MLAVKIVVYVKGDTMHFDTKSAKLSLLKKFRIGKLINLYKIPLICISGLEHDF